MSLSDPEGIGSLACAFYKASELEEKALFAGERFTMTPQECDAVVGSVMCAVTVELNDQGKLVCVVDDEADIFACPRMALMGETGMGNIFRKMLGTYKLPGDDDTDGAVTP